MLRIRIGMTPQEVRETVGAADKVTDLATMMLENLRQVTGADEDADWKAMTREVAQAEGIELPEEDDDSELPQTDVWTYFDLPHEGDATMVSFKDGRVMMVSYGAKD